ncbi:MAG: hypothetical protein LBP79_00815 [Clostridiales bacterium]|jgi:hypothetical protein|nr:hypothetical protein [Clostridiales bacterium]
MKVLTTALPARAIVTAEAVTVAVLRWIKSGDAKAAEALNDLDTGQDFTRDIGDNTLTRLCVKDDNTLTLGIRYEARVSSAMQWTTDVIYRECGDKKTVRVDIATSSLYGVGYSTQRRQMRTGIIQALAEAGLFEGDGAFKIGSQPIVADLNNLDYIARLIKGEETCRLPVIYVSTIIDSMGHEINTTEMAKDLCGIAHVVEEANNTVSVELRNKIGGNFHITAISGYIAAQCNFQNRYEIRAIISRRLKRKYLTR